MNKNKVALILEGGAMRGSFIKGVLDCFKKNDIEFPYIVGVSAGAITGFEFVTGIDFDINKLFGEFSKNMDIFKNSSEPVDFQNLVYNFFEFPDQINNDIDTKFEICATSLVDGSVKFFSMNEAKSTKEVVDYVLASSSLPDMVKPILIDGIPYYDGGMYNTNPIDRAIDLKFDKFVCVLARNRGYRRENSVVSDLVANRLSDYKQFLNTMSLEGERYNSSMDLIDNLEKEDNALVFAPVKPLKFKSFTTNIQDIIDLYTEGYQLATENIDKLKEFIQEI